MLKGRILLHSCTTKPNKTSRVGQEHIYWVCVYTVLVAQGSYPISGHVRCAPTVLANPKNEGSAPYPFHPSTTTSQLLNTFPINPFFCGYRLFPSFCSEAPQRHLYRCNFTLPCPIHPIRYQNSQISNIVPHSSRY